MLACIACAPERASVEVQLVTDYPPGTTFDGVVSTLSPGPAPLSVSAAIDRSYRRPVRVAVFDDLAPGQIRVSVALMLGGTLVQSQPRVTELRAGQTSIVTVAITHDCAGVTCPTDSPAAIACLGGRCTEPTSDADGDGIDDAVDLCPSIADATQDDEDDDGLGDACDPCPPYADGMVVADQDGDGVSDSCDPAPMVAGDRITRFEGFGHYVPGSLTLQGTWDFSGGQAITTGMLNQVAVATVPRPDGGGAGTQETVQTHATIDAYFGTSLARPVGVIHELDAMRAGGIVCVFGTNPTNNEVFAIADDMTLSALTAAPTMAPVGASAAFRSTRSGTSYTCESPALTTPLMATSTFASGTPQVGLYARSLSARFDWLLVTTRP